MKKTSLLTSQIIQMLMPIIVLGVAIAFIGISFSGIINELAETFEKESFKSISLVLNADRDFYQALDGYNKTLIYPADSPEYAASLESYNSNIGDVEERMGLIGQLADENSDIADLTLTDQSAKVDVTLDKFFSEFEDWKAATQDIIDQIEAGASEEVLMEQISNASTLFDISRDKLNTIGEALELYPTLLSDKYIGSTYNTMMITYLVVIALTIITIVISILYTRKTTKQVNVIVTEQSTLARGLRSASFQLSESSRQLSEGANEQAASIEETSATMDETSSMVRQNAENTNQANNFSKQAIEAANAGTEKMQEMIGSMNELKKSSGEISKIIKVIDEIAFQTNMLALNAAVEAARAGDAGQGFAVVAEEVRNLAQKSAQAAKDTAEIIDRNIELSESGAALSEDVNVSLNEIMEKAKNVNQLMEEISAASSEQARGTAQVTEAISQMEQVVQRNAANAEQSSTTAEELQSQSRALEEAVSRLNVFVKGSNKAKQIDESKNDNKAVQAKKLTQGPPASQKKHIMSPDDVIPLDGDDNF